MLHAAPRGTRGSSVRAVSESFSEVTATYSCDSQPRLTVAAMLRNRLFSQLCQWFVVCAVCSVCVVCGVCVVGVPVMSAVCFAVLSQYRPVAGSSPAASAAKDSNPR